LALRAKIVSACAGGAAKQGGGGAVGLCGGREVLGGRHQRSMKSEARPDAVF
jgi:hypothetical protein